MNERRSDFDLLQRFVRHGEQSAFADVVRRHLDLVFATALRKLADPAAAQEVAQNVFTVLARKAWRFAPDDSLPAWLHKTALLESKSWLRSELRRRRREQTAAELGTTMKTPDEQPAFNALVPLLDEALLSLREKDRTALLLRFYESQSLREVGSTLGVAEDAAQKRVHSALTKLCRYFQRRGFRTVTLASITATLRGTAASTSAAASNNVIKFALQPIPPALTGLTGALCRLANLTRMQKTVAVLAVVVATIWFWQGKSEIVAEMHPEPDLTPAPQVSRRPRIGSQTGSTHLDDSPEPGLKSAQVNRHVEIVAEIETFSDPRYSTDDLRYVAKPIYRNYSLVCIAGTNTWRINNGYRETGTTQWWFDGTNVYQKIISTGEAKTNASVHIRASQDGCPLGEPIVNLSWLAFCSGTYLKREGRLVPLPLAMLRHAPDGFAYSDVTETFQDELGLPRSTDLFASVALFEASVTNGVFLGKKDVELWKRGSTGFKWNFPERAHRFHYGVAESTNFLGWNLPVKFEWYLNEYENGGLIARSGGRGKVTSIRTSEEPGSVILPGATNQNIVDWRFRDVAKGVDAIIYVPTNAFASPTNDPELQRKFEARIKKALTH